MKRIPTQAIIKVETTNIIRHSDIINDPYEDLIYPRIVSLTIIETDLDEFVESLAMDSYKTYYFNDNNELTEEAEEANGLTHNFLKHFDLFTTFKLKKDYLSITINDFDYEILKAYGVKFQLEYKQNLLINDCSYGQIEIEYINNKNREIYTALKNNNTLRKCYLLALATRNSPLRA